MFRVNVKQSDSVQGTPGKVYPASTKPRGLVLLINNEHFQSGDFHTRAGAGMEERNLETLFIQLGFSVLVRRDLTRQDMVEEIER